MENTMNLASYAKNNGIYLGHFNLIYDQLPFTYDGPKSRAEISKMGDVVYFMYVAGKLMKIGKAGGKQGFAGRAGTYKMGRAGDSTNNKIIDVLESINETQIHVYAFVIPKIQLPSTCPINGETIYITTSVHGEYESRYTEMYLSESAENTLPFCTQLK